MTDLTLNKLINIDYIQSKSGLSKIALYENKSFVKACPPGGRTGILNNLFIIKGLTIL